MKDFGFTCLLALHLALLALANEIPSTTVLSRRYNPQVLGGLRTTINLFANNFNSRLRGGSAGTVMVTGGAGYIGSHCIVALQESGYEVIVVDNFSNSCPKSLERVAEITGKKLQECYDVDIRDRPALETIFQKHKGRIDAVIHCAGLKAVGESVREPLAYYENNFVGTLNLLKVMAANDCKALVFSSSATVYGSPRSVPINEDFPLSCTNPYGRTKLFIEEMLRDVVRSDPEWRVINLRYFNPVGAHPSRAKLLISHRFFEGMVFRKKWNLHDASVFRKYENMLDCTPIPFFCGLIGEDPAGLPNNLMPYIAKVAVGKLKQLTVFGDDYETPDGTGVRDYIHVVDLAAGHVAAVKKITQLKGEVVYNLGTGQGYSVLEMVKAMEKASGKQIPFVVGPRRPGDIAECFAESRKALEELGWKAVKTIQDMCADTWNWQSRNPAGYRAA